MRDWLRNARSDKGLTMKQMADELHISESYYCSIEGGYRQRSMDFSLADKISTILGIPLKDILRFEAELKEQEPAAERRA